MTPEELAHALKRPFNPKAISWRVGSTNAEKTKGLALAYIDARDVMQRLDEAVGMFGWQDSYVETVKGRLMCTLSINVGGDWIAKSDGAGDTDVEGEKGAISDAFKRAAVKWGIGRYLYYLDSPWVPITAAGKSFKITDASAIKLPDWATPEGYDKKKPEKEPPNTPLTGAWEAMDAESQAFLQSIATQVAGLVTAGDIAGAVKHIEDQKLNAEEKVAMWSRLDSKQRSTIKKEMNNARF